MTAMPLVRPHDSFHFSRLLSPLRQERLWVTFLWTLTLSVGVAGVDWAERWFAADAAGRSLLLLPREALDEGRRQAARAKLDGEPGILSARWRSPAELTRQVAGRFPQSEWQGLFPADEAWLPWVLEVRPASPLDDIALIRAFLARREQEGNWRLVLWDGESVQRLARARTLARAVAGFWLALAALGGMAALLRLPWPERGGVALVILSAILGVLGPAAVWAAALLAESELGAGNPGLTQDPRPLLIALATGFILATLAAPVLRLRRRKPESTV